MNLPAFNQTLEIENLALEIIEILEVMEKVGDIDLLFNLRKASRISSIQSSVAIEANSLSLEQVTDIVNGRKVLGDPEEILEVKNAWKAYQGIDEYNPYSIESFLKVHFLIEYVHPFEDGNGRMGRLWQTVILANWMPVLEWVPVETMVYQNQFGYYDALSSSEKANDAAPFVVFMLNIIAYTLGVIIKSKAVPRAMRNVETVPLPYKPDFSVFPDKIPDKTDMADDIPDIFTDKISKSEREFLLAIYPYLCQHGEINNYRAQTLTGKSADSVRKYFAKLVSIGFLQAIGEKKARVYRFANFDNGAPAEKNSDTLYL